MAEAGDRTLRRVGADGLLIECAGSGEAAALAAWLAEHVDPPPVELVPAASTVLVVAAPGDGDALRAALAAAPPAPELADRPIDAGPPVRIPVRYDGPDLADTAAALGMSAERLVAEHAAAAWRVDFIGFAPGFGYCSAPDWPHRVPRLDSPRERVPAGAVAIADGWSAVYPRASPGGWRLIGTTDAALWDQERTPPALLAAGATVRFEAEST